MKMQLNPDDVIERSVDSRGRVRIGPEFRHEAVWVAMIAAADDEFDGPFDSEAAVDVLPDDVVDRKADSRGRVRISPKYAGRTVRVSVIRTADV